MAAVRRLPRAFPRQESRPRHASPARPASEGARRSDPAADPRAPPAGRRRAPRRFLR